MRFRTLKALLIAVTVAVIAGCGGGGDINGGLAAGQSPAAQQIVINSDEQKSGQDLVSPQAVQKLSSNALKGYADPSSIWPSNSIPVCYVLNEDGFSAYEGHRAIIRAAIAGSWEANSRIQFTGWERCPDPAVSWFVGIKIKFADTRPSSPVGTAVHPLGMYLNPVYNFYYYKDCNGQVKKCLEFDAIHEFGHALGFSHEQNRPDTPESCAEEKDKNSDGYTPIGGWDLYSIMNYCNPNFHKVGGGTQSD